MMFVTTLASPVELCNLLSTSVAQGNLGLRLQVLLVDFNRGGLKRVGPESPQVVPNTTNPPR